MKLPVLLASVIFLSIQTGVADTGFGVVITDPVPEVIVEEKIPEPTQPEKTFKTVLMTVTAYTASIEECGNNDGITASGKQVQEGMVASDDLPFGTKVIINGKQYVVEDRFGGNYRNRIDIYMTSRASAERFGRKYINVEVEVK